MNDAPLWAKSAAEVAAGRMQRKLARRDKRIAGLVRRVAILEHALATQAVDAERLPRDVTRAVQAAFCNVRITVTKPAK